MCHHLPNHTVGCKSKPSLQDDGYDACPIKYQTHLKLHDHIAKSDVKDDEGKRVHKCEEEKSVGYPSVEHLELLVRDTREKCDPVRLGCCRAAKEDEKNQYFKECVPDHQRGLQDKRHACQSHPSRSCPQGWRAAKIQTWPVIWLWNQIHAWQHSLLIPMPVSSN